MTGTVRVVDVDRDHPAFAGHFPGAPVLPGVVILGWVLQAADAQPGAPDDGRWCVEQVKFLGPVGPGSRLRITLTPLSGGTGFEVLHGDRPVARGRLSPLQPDGSPHAAGDRP
jgi:3-hydroxyacyl-[acyl-carrier-protein] dehydratase